MLERCVRSFVVLYASGALLAASAACAKPAANAGVDRSALSALPAVALGDEAGGDVRLGEVVSRAKLTILVFFDAACPVQKAHDGRLRELAATYGPRGVSFFGVVSDVGADMPAERAAAKQRGLPPLLEDRGAKLASVLGVEFSTHVVVLDANASVLYSGGIDSDRTHLSAGRERWLEDAVSAALEGRPIASRKTEALGCPLRTR